MARRKSQSFGETIRARRRQLDWTQEEVAREVGTSVPYIVLLESDKRRPSDGLLGRLADALGLDRSQLFFLANPEAKALLREEPNEGASAWDQFRNDERLQRMYDVSEQEMEILSRVAMMGEVRGARDFVFILNTVRQALSG
jgi:transcriptional regulator with XRE-family HTH domain